jgi:hypothetical protein
LIQTQLLILLIFDVSHLMCFFFHCHQITQSSSLELPAFRMFRQGTEELPELQKALEAWNVQMPKDLMSETRREALEAPQDLFVSTGSWGDGGDMWWLFNDCQCLEFDEHSLIIWLVVWNIFPIYWE